MICNVVQMENIDTHLVRRCRSWLRKSEVATEAMIWRHDRGAFIHYTLAKNL